MSHDTRINNIEYGRGRGEPGKAKDQELVGSNKGSEKVMAAELRVAGNAVGSDAGRQEMGHVAKSHFGA